MTQYQRSERILRNGYIQEYFDSGGHIKCELLTTTAEKVALELGQSGVTSTQLRQFFTQVRAIERQLGQKDFPALVPQIERLEPLAANYVGKGRNNYERQDRQILKIFIDTNARLASKNVDNFTKGFIPHFESVVAYFKFHFPGRD